MSLRCVFHVIPPAARATEQDVRPRSPSVVDVDVDFDDEPSPRGVSIETWRRARGWSTEEF